MQTGSAGEIQMPPRGGGREARVRSDRRRAGACGAREAAEGRRSPAPRVPVGRTEEKGDRGGSGSLDGWFAERQKFPRYAVGGGTSLILQLPLR
jgi:hypothetical protein